MGLVNGSGWALCQNWKWAAGLWPDANFNWWRCWESSGGLSIGLALGAAYFLVNRPLSASEQAELQARQSIERSYFESLLVYLLLAALMTILLLSLCGWWGMAYGAVLLLFGVVYFLQRSADDGDSGVTPADSARNLERLGLYLGLLFGLGISIRAGLKGWFNIYYGNEDYWSGVLWMILGPIYLVILIALCAGALRRPTPGGFRAVGAREAAALMWLVLIVQNVLGQLVTGPWSNWNEVVFSLYYVLLFAITAAVAAYYTAYQRGGADGARQRHTVRSAMVTSTPQHSG